MRKKSVNESTLRKKEYDKEHKTLAGRAWALFSRTVRITGTDKSGYRECYTCGRRFDWKSLCAGHYHHTRQKIRDLDIDYNERNIKPQCWGCNSRKFGNGKPREFIKHLVDDYGAGIVGELYQANDSRRKLTNQELKEIIEKYGSKN